MECLNCGFKNDDDAVFCEECGACLENYCSNDDCEFNDCGYEEPVQLNPTAKYCKVCGSESTFKVNGFFDK